MTRANWEDIRAEVLSRIRLRKWLPGAVIPTEEALANEFGCARATVSRALRELAGGGVLERRRKAGTRVALHPVRKATLDIAVTRLEIEARGQVYGYHLLESAMAVPPIGIQSKLGVVAGAAWLHLRCLHLADGRAHLYEDRWLNPAVFLAPVPDFAVISANEWLVGNISYARGDISFSAENASAAEAEMLAVGVGAALFITERGTWGEAAPITWVRLAYAPGYRLHTAV